LQAMRRKMDALKKTAARFRQLEKTLRTGEQRFEAIYRCLPVPTITWKRQGQDFTIIDYNIAAEEFTAGLMANFIGKRASLVYHDRPDIREKLARCFAEQSTLKEETPYRMFTKGDQKVIAFTFTYVPPDLVLSHMEDITGRKSAEEKIRRSEKQLRTLSTRLLTTAENERRHIARELHDSIGQYLTAIKLNAENTADLLARHQPEEAMTHLHAGIPLIRQTIDEIRRMMMDLRPTILDDLGILATLSWLCREMQAVHPRVALEKNIRIAERDIPEPLKIIIYRIVQESLHNALKHSQEAHIQIDMTEKRKQVVLAVTDNGVGFDPQAVRSRLSLP
jgi:signal transduction histidine kinase